MTKRKENPQSGGRPSDYTEALGLTICQRISNGESLRAVCRDKDMPAMSTVMLWTHSRPEFSEQYRVARENLLEHWAEDILEISDDGEKDYTTIGEGTDAETERVNTEHISRSRLRVDSRKWLLSKLAPKKYGDKQHIEHTGALTLEQLVAQSGLEAK